MQLTRLTDRSRIRPILLIGIFALLLAGMAAPPAAANFKDDFKKGCNASGNDFVENASDDSFSCNIKSGGTIKCTDADGKTPCSYTAKISNSKVLSGLRAGKQLTILAQPTKPVHKPVNQPTETAPPTKPN